MKAVVAFDLYETLITEFDPDYEPPAPSVASRLGLAEKPFETVWKSINRLRMTGSVADYPAALRFVCRALNVLPNEQVIAELTFERVRLKTQLFKAIDPDITELIISLRRRGYRLALLSNAAIEEILGWAGCELEPYFDLSVFSYQTGYCKPDPEIYNLLCDHFRIRPETVAFVGDGSSDELLGAARVGFKPYRARWFTERWPPELQPNFGRGASAFPSLSRPADLLEHLS